MSVQVEPYQLRFLASRMSAGSQEIRIKANRLENIMNELVQGSWKGEGAHAFAVKCEVMKGEMQKTADVLDNAIQTLNRFANQMERVNQLRQQANMMEQQSWQYSGESIDELHHRQNLARQAAQIRQEAEWEANAADAQAAHEFQAIMAMIPQLMEQAGQFIGSNNHTGELDDLPEPLKSYYLRHMGLLQDDEGETAATLNGTKNASNSIMDQIEQGVKKAEDFIGGAMYALENNALMGIPQHVMDDDAENRSKEYQEGKVLGDGISVGLGAVAAVDGVLLAIIGAGGGIITSPTGVGALAGGAVAAVGVGEAVYGVGETIVSISNLENDKMILSKTNHDGGGSSSETQGESSENTGIINSSKNDSPHYGHIPDSLSVGPGKKFTKAQKEKIIQENKNANGGVVKSDKSGIELVKPQKSAKDVSPDQKEWQIDHVFPRSKGGSNSYGNAQVLSRKENREKSDN